MLLLLLLLLLLVCEPVTRRQMLLLMWLLPQLRQLAMGKQVLCEHLFLIPLLLLRATPTRVLLLLLLLLQLRSLALLAPRLLLLRVAVASLHRWPLMGCTCCSTLETVVAMEQQLFHQVGCSACY